ncbi:Uma2 family endonuclease [Micromonospora sp. NPDC049559]|uniref:Uma2 family endonuclease n=1 Tax=Micromonospora sp. NPDC049559 TaxID=3155923 RepID=UPI00342EE235
MSAEPIPESPVPWQPDPIRQRRADYTLEDLLNLPPDAPRVELVDGKMAVVPSPTEDHQSITALVWTWLRAHAPQQYQAALAVGVAITPRDSREPDVLLRYAGGGGKRHFFTPDQVLLAVEVVSPGTRRTDRLVKPVEYATAGIPYYWRVEQDPVHVYAYRLADRPGPSGNREYELITDSAELLEIEVPFPIKLSIADITP